MEKFNIIMQMSRIVKERNLKKYLCIDFLMRLFIASQMFVSSSLYIDFMIKGYEHERYMFMGIITVVWCIFNLLFIFLRYKFDLKINGQVFYNLVLELRKDSVAQIWDNKDSGTPDEQFNYLGYNITDLAVMLFNADKILAYIIVVTVVYIWSLFISSALTGFLFIFETLFLVLSVLSSKKQNMLNAEIFNKSSDLRTVHNNLYEAAIDNLNNNIYEKAVKSYEKKIDGLFKLKFKSANIKIFVGNLEVVLYSVTYVLAMILAVKFNFIQDKNLLIVIMSNYIILHNYMNLISKVIIDFSKKKYIIDQYNDIHSGCRIESKLTNLHALKIENLSFSVNNNLIVDGIDITVEKNQKVALIGFNGAGKSSILKCITEEAKDFTGKISVINNRIGFIDNKVDLLPVSIKDNINYGSYDHEINAMNQEQFTGIIKDITHDLNEPLTDCEDSLSSGEQQRVSIARALFSDLDLIIADEPTSNLNKSMEKYVFEQILQNSKALLYVSHNPDLVKKADYIYILDKGKIIKKGTYKEICLSDEYNRWSNEVINRVS